MNILKYFGLDAKPCKVCGKDDLPSHSCETPGKWSRRGFLSFAGLLGATIPILGTAQVAEAMSEPLIVDPVGFSIRFIRAFDPISTRMITRLDCLYEHAEQTSQIGVDIEDPTTSSIMANSEFLKSMIPIGAKIRALPLPVSVEEARYI